MSKLKEQLEVDILRFLENIETQNFSDKVQTLRHLFDKHLHLNKAEHLMDAHDLFTIISNAKNLFATQKVPIRLGVTKRQVGVADISSLCLVEATVAHLNKKDCLKKMVKFDKRDDEL